MRVCDSILHHMHIALLLVQVGHPVQRQVKLVNNSDGVLRYCLECGPAATQLADASELAAAAVATAGHAQQADQQQQHVVLSAAAALQHAPMVFSGGAGGAANAVLPPAHASGGAPGGTPELWVDEPVGTIAARCVFVVHSCQT